MLSGGVAPASAGEELAPPPSWEEPHAAPLVEVGAAGEDPGDLARRGPHDAHGATVTDHGGSAEAWQVRQGQLADRLTQVVGSG